MGQPLGEQPDDRSTRDWPTEQPVLTDGLVRLRALQPGDVPDVLQICQDRDIQHFTRVPVPYLAEHAEFFVAQGSPRWRTREAAAFAVVDASTDRLLGACGLVEVDLPRREGWAGYWVAPTARGRGVARSALALLTEWCLGDGGLDRVCLEIEEANPASVAVAVAARFTRTGEVVTEEMKGIERRFLTYERRRG